MVRELANIYRPHLIVEIPFNIKHPFSWVAEGITDDIIRAVIEYPHPHLKVEIPDSHVSYAVSQFRGNLELAISLENEISGNDYLHFETTRAPDGGPELPDDSYGLAGPIIMFQKLMERWMHIDLPAARIEINRWPGSDQHLFARLRIWAAGHPLLCADQSAEIFLSLTDRVFWFSLHERDLLYAIRDRWRDLPSDARSALEIRLRTGSYPWNEDVQGSVEQKAAYHRLSRLHWLSGQGVVFSFDLSAEMERLHEIEPEWTETAGNTVADSHSSAAYSIAIDDNADALLNTPISEILPKAQEIGTRDFFDRAQREPFLGLSKRHPSRALAALTHAGRNNVGQSSAWSTFLHVDTRPDDRVRMIQVIAMRLIRLPVGQFEIIIYSISEWMKSIAMRLYGDANSILGPLWDRMIIILSMSTGDGYRKSERSWIKGALNAPVGKLINLLMKDPAINDLPNSFGLPTHWTARADQLLNLPGDLRCQALVMLGHQLAWLYFIDPIWTTKSLLPAAEDRGDDGTAFWEGVLRVVRWPTPELFQCLKTELFYRARRNSNRQKHSNSIAFLLFGGWLNGTHLGQEKLVSDSEFREILIHADDELRRNCIWQLTQFLKDKKYRIQIMSFLMDVWPKQRALRTPSISAKLTEFALESGDLMPRVVELILPRLMPATFEIMFLKKEVPDHPARQYPKTTLDLLWVVLAEDPRQWPYLIEDVLQLLSEAPETSNDSRLSELKRRRDRLI